MSIKKLAVALMIVISSVSYAQTGHYEWNALPFGGAGFVSGIITCPQQEGVVYARTDVGGAYRWNPDKEEWTPISDFLPENKAGLMGVESMAIDPSSPNIVYMYCGTSYWNSGLSAILCSEDYGDTFTQLATVTSQFPAHGNDYGRQSGERLAVCPLSGAASSVEHSFQTRIQTSIRCRLLKPLSCSVKAFMTCKAVAMQNVRQYKDYIYGTERKY